MNPLQRALQLLQGGANTFVPQTSKHFSNAARSLTDKKMTAEEKKKAYQQFLDPKSQLKMGLELGSFAVPFGKGANIATKALLPGAAVGGMSSLSKEEVNPKNLAMDIAGGAAGAGLMAGASKIAGKATKSLTKALPERLMDSVFKEPLKDTRAAVKKGTSLGKEALEKGLTGGAENIYNKSVSEINLLEDSLQSALTQSKRIIPLSDIKKSIQPLIEKYNKSGNISAVKNISDRITALEQYNGKSIPVAVANEIKRTLYDEARNGYGQLASENIEGVKAVARALKESIAEKVPNANDLNKKLSFNGRVADSMMEKLVKEGRNNMFGLTDAIISTGGGALGAGAVIGKKVLGSTVGKTNVANILNKTGNAIDNINSPISQDVMGQLTARLPQILSSQTDNNKRANATNNEANNKVFDQNNTINSQQNGIITDQNTASQQQIDPNEEVTLLDGTKATFGQLQQQGTFSQPEQGGSQISDEQWQQLFIADLMQNGGKNLDKLATVKELISPQSDIDTRLKELELVTKQKELTDGKALTGDEQKMANNATSGLRSLAEIESTLGDSPENPLMALPDFIGGNQAYQTSKENLIDVIGRLRSGGAIGAEEEKRFRKLLPGATKSAETNKKDLGELKKLLSSFIDPRNAQQANEEFLMNYLNK